MKEKQEQKYEYSIFFNGVTWTCEIEDDEGVDEWCTGSTPIEALKNALDIK